MDRDLKRDENYYYFATRQETRVDLAEHETMLLKGPSSQPEQKMFSDEQSRFYKTQENMSVACEIEIYTEQCVTRAVDGNRLGQN
jgi:hypothetical protein